jgi:hypothetical protein
VSALRHTIRLLLKSPGFTITAVLVLSFGIGTTAAMFSVIDAVLLRPFPYPKPDRLIQFYLTDQGKENALLDFGTARARARPWVAKARW